MVEAEGSVLEGHHLSVKVACAAGEVWSGSARSVVCTTSEGKIGILPGHSPILATLARCRVEIHQQGGKVLINAEDGFLSVADDAVTIIAAGASLLGESGTETDEGSL